MLYCWENWNIISYIEAMGKARFLLILTTFLACTSASDVRVSMASVILEEGQTGNIFCVVKGIGSYYWRKGDSIDNSTKVASIVSGVPSAGDGSYSVYENGTLFIRRVVLEDEGKYFCRVASDETDCSGEVMIYVQASLPNFVIGIDRCYTKNSCLVLIDSSQSTSLTCVAKNTSYSMILKWFDGSTEITNHIRKNSSTVQGVREISSTLDVAHGNTGSLTCQAVEPKGRNDNGRFAHVQLEMPEVPFMPEVPVMPDDNRLGSLLVALITSGVWIILVVILLLVKVFFTRRNRKSKGNVQGKELESLMTTKEDKEEHIVTLDTEITILKGQVVNKDKEIAEMKEKEKKNEKQITEQKEEISNLRMTKETKTGQTMKPDKVISRLEANVEHKKKQIAKQKVEISSLKEELNNREREIAKMKEKLKRKPPKNPNLSVEEPQQKVEELQQLDVEMGDVSDRQ